MLIFHFVWNRVLRLQQRNQGPRPNPAGIVRGDLVPVLPDHLIGMRELFAVYPHNCHLSPKMRALIDFATEIYRAPRWC